MVEANFINDNKMMVIEKAALQYFTPGVSLARQRNWMNIFSHDEIFKAFTLNKFIKYSTIAKETPNDESCQSSVKGNSKGSVATKLATSISLNTEVNHFLSNHSKLLTHKSTRPSEIYILDKNIATKIYKLIVPELEKTADFFFEVNPGPGVMTDVLLENGVKPLRVFETKEEFLPYLKVLKQKYKFEIMNENFLNVASIYKKDIITNEDTLGVMLKDINYRAWMNSPPLQIFAIMPNSAKERAFLNYMLRSYILFQNVFSFGRTQFFLFVSNKEYEYMTATPDKSWINYRNTSVLYQTLFDIKLLHVEPRTSFFPPLAKKQNSRSSYDTDNMYLVLLRPKKFILDVLSPNLFHEFGFFVFNHLSKRTTEVIPALEKWIPNSSSRFRKQGLDMKTRFGDLNSTQILVLFLYFSSMEGYSDSSFRIAVRKDAYFNHDFTVEEADNLEQEDSLDFEVTDN